MAGIPQGDRAGAVVGRRSRSANLDRLRPNVGAAGGHDLPPAVEDGRPSGHGLAARVHARGHVDAAALPSCPDALHRGGVALAERAVELGVALEHPC